MRSNTNGGREREEEGGGDGVDGCTTNGVDSKKADCMFYDEQQVNAQANS